MGGDAKSKMMGLPEQNTLDSSDDLLSVSCTYSWKRKVEKGTDTHSSILAWRIPWTEEPGGLPVHEVTNSRTQLSNFHRTQDSKVE